MAGWFLAPLAALWAYALLETLGEAFSAVKEPLVWISALGAYSGKTGLALAAFVGTALVFRRPPRAWECWAVVLPGLYAAALVASFPPVTAALAHAARHALPW